MKAKLFLYILIFNNLWLVAQNPLETVVQRGHQKPVTCAVFSPNGKFVASGSLDNSIKLWSIETGLEIRTFYSHTGKVRDVVFSLSGSLIASVAADNELIVHNILTGEVVNKFSYQRNDVHEVRFSYDEKFLITYDNAEKVTIWELKTNKEFASLKKDYSGRFNTHSLPKKAFYLPHVVDSKNLALINIVNKDTLLQVPLENYYSSAFSSDGNFLAIGSEKLETHIIDVRSKKLIHSLISDKENECYGCNTKLAFANLSNLLLSGTNKNGISLWDVATGKKQYTISIEEGFNYLEMSADDKYFLVSDDDFCILYETKTGKEIYKVENEFLDYFTPHFAPLGNTVLFPTANNTFSVFDIEAKKTVSIFNGYLNHDKNDGLELSYSNWIDDKILQYVSMKTQIALSTNAKYIAKGNVDSTVFILDVETGRVIKKLKGHSKLVYRMEFSHDGTLLATAGADRKILLWDTKTWQKIGELKGHVQLVFDLKFSSDDAQLVSSAWDAYVIHWDIKTQKIIHFNNLDNTSVYSLGYSLDGLYQVHGDLDKKINYVEQDSKEVAKPLVGHTHVLSEVVFGKHKDLFTASWDGTVKQWDFLSGLLIAKHKQHTGAVLSLALDSTTNYVYSGGVDGEIVVWNTTKNSIVKKLKAHTNALSSLRVSNSYLVSSSADGEIKVWDKKTLIELYTYRQINESDWLVTNPSGYFDGTANAQKLVNYVKGLEVIPISSLFNKYYTPNLSKRIMAGEKFTYNDAEFNNKIQLIPELKIGFNAKDNHILSTDSVLISKSDYVYLDIKVHSSQSFLFTTHIFKNGKLISDVLLPRGVDVTKNHVPIHLSNGLNVLEIIVENELGYESTSKQMSIFFDGKKAKTDLYVLAVGINEYKNPQYNLSYALNDAKSFSDALSQQSDSLFEHKYFTLLKNEEATKSSILSKWSEIEKEIGPEDVFVFFFAGHGSLSLDAEDKKFFLIPHNQTKLAAYANELEENALSGDDLVAFSAKISAEKQLYVLDACQSGGALQTFASRGAEREKALAQLARSTGTYFLTASQEYQLANESNELKHGMFTYAILEALSGKHVESSFDSKITVGEIKNYVEERVPELSKEYNSMVQYPQSYSFGQDFPLVIVNGK